MSYKIRIEQFDAVVDGVDEADAWAGVEAFLTREFTDDQDLFNQEGYDTALAQVLADHTQEQSTTSAGVGAKAWYAANPLAALLFELTISDLEQEISDLVDGLYPLATPGQRNKEKLWRMTVSMTSRVTAKRLGFVE